MPKPRPASSVLGIGRGGFRKAVLTLLLQRHQENDAMDVAIQEFGNQCVYCGMTNEDAPVQPDFLWPESMGGTFVKGNVVPACPTCNSSRQSQAWEEFLRRSVRIRKRQSTAQSEQTIQRIDAYMRRFGKNQCPSLEEVLTPDEVLIREQVDLLLSAMSQGVRARIDKAQKSAVSFRDPRQLFEKLVATAQAFELNSDRS